MLRECKCVYDAASIPYLFQKDFDTREMTLISGREQRSDAMLVCSLKGERKIALTKQANKEPGQ